MLFDWTLDGSRGNATLKDGEEKGIDKLSVRQIQGLKRNRHTSLQLRDTKEITKLLPI